MTTGTETQNELTGGILKALREAVGLSQTELGERVGRSKSHISRFECGHREASPELRARIAQVCADEAHRLAATGAAA